MVSVDAQIESQAFVELIPVIKRTVDTISNEYVVKMIFIFSDVLLPNEYQDLLTSTISNSEKIVHLLQFVLKNKKFPPVLFINIWGELLFLTKLYKHLKVHGICKHQMRAQQLRGATFASSEFQRLLLLLSDNLTDDDVRYIWMTFIKDGKPSPQQPEMLFHEMLFEKKMKDIEILNELSVHFKVLGRTELVQEIQWYLENVGACVKREESSTTRVEYDLVPSRPNSYCGVALIFNNKTFTKTPHPSVTRKPLEKLSERKGTEVDAKKLDELWRSFGIFSKVYNDTCSFEFNNHLNYWLNQDLSTVKIFIVCILTHGENGVVYMSDRIDYRTSDIEAFLGRSTKLAGKPKLLFIQACQGHAVQSRGGNAAIARRVELDGPNDTLQRGPPVPQYSDMLIGLATVPGFMSIRNIKDGTHFIQTLVNVLKAKGTKEDISLLITEINHQVTKMWANTEYKGNQLCLVQMPTFHNQLTKGLRFKEMTVNPENWSQ